MKTYRVYKWTNKQTGGFYIGSTNYSKETRAGYKMCMYKNCRKFWEAIQQYGEDSFDYSVIKDGLPLEDARALETQLIVEGQRDFPDLCYNISKPMPPSEEINKKISKTLTEQRSDPEYRKKMSDRMRTVWSSPERREHMLQERRRKKKGGVTPRPVMLKETGKVYKTCRECALDIGISPSHICMVLKRNPAVLKRKDGTIYTFILL